MRLLPSLDLAALAELARRDAWVCWRACANPVTGKLTKVPFTPAGSPASHTNPRTWSTYAECFAAAYVEGAHAGIGRVLVGDGIVGVDLDGCCDPATGAIVHTDARWIVDALASFTERSPSRTSLHIWCRGSWPTDGSKRPGLEVYRRRRYLTVSGDHLAGTPEDIRRADLRPLWQRFASRQGNGACSQPVALLRQRLGLADAPQAVDVAALAHRYPQLRRILAASYPSASERDLALVRFAKLSQRSPADAWALLLAVRHDGKSARPDYAARTIAQIYLEDAR